jgi:SAM-dependent methyltransferase
MTDPSGTSRGAQPFDHDAAEHGGYLYADPARYSAVVANARMTTAILDMTDFAGKRVIDIGCGDGTYTKDLVDAGAREVFGVDGAPQAIEVARSKKIPNTRFEALDVTGLQVEERYDAALVRGVIHHIDHVEPVIERICAAARVVVIVEPNGYNPVLKVLEKVSPYHREHGERSYSKRRLDRWFAAHGGVVERFAYVGLVPMFCPTPMAKLLKKVEPFVEGQPGLRAITCGQYVACYRIT